MQHKAPTFLIASLLATAACALATPPNFRRDIQPILEANCLRCHKEDKAKGGLRMDTHPRMMEGGEEGEAIVPGHPEKSELIIRTHLRPIDEGFMPDEGQALGEEQLALLTAWVKAGAEWPEGVTLAERKPAEIKRVAMPARAPKDFTDAAAMLDAILTRENADEEVVTTPVIGDDAFLRRATIDLVGRIPTMKEIALYAGWGERRRAQLVARLVEDPRFADRWTIFLADMLRIRSNVTGGNELLAYVHGGLADGKPYDVMVRELISASGKPNANPAVGYLLGDETDPMELAAATSQVFLGVRIGCAMCHDHPFDDWEQKDFYDLAAFFGKTRQVRNDRRNQVYTTEGKEMAVLWPPENKADPDQRKPVEPHFPFALVDDGPEPPWLARFRQKRTAQDAHAKAGEKDAALDALLDAAEPAVGRKSDPVLAEARDESRKLDVLNDLYRASELRSQLAELVTSPRNGYFARAFVNRVWAELLGHGFVEPLDNFSDYNELRHATTLDFLAQEFVASGYDLRSLVTIIMLSDAYRRSHPSHDVPVTKREEAARHFAAAPVRRMLGEVLYDSENNRVLVVTKRDLPAIIFSVPLQPGSDAVLDAERIGALTSIPQPREEDIRFAPVSKDWHWQPTAMDIAADGSALIVLTYGAIYYFDRQPGVDWPERLAQGPLAFDLKDIRDAEAAALSNNGEQIFISVERKHAPLLRIDIGPTR